MSDTVKFSSQFALIRHRASLGWQCPECFGVQVECQENRFTGRRSDDRFTCQECGCQWGPDIAEPGK
jgi:transposase